MKKKWIGIMVLGAIVICSLSALSIGFTAGTIRQMDMPVGEPHLGYVKIQGALMDALPILKQIRVLKEDQDLAGFLIRIDSPGGAVGAAQEIYRVIEELRADSLPVIVSYGNVSASGGVYASASATKIFSLPGTITGSVGVITQFPQVDGVLDKLGVEMHTVKSGGVKDIASPFRTPNKADLEVMKAVIEDSYDQFVESIVAYRDVKKDSVQHWADGRIFTGRVAKKIGLVDTLGGFHEALAYAREVSGLTEEAPLIEFVGERPFLESLVGEPLGELKEEFRTQGKGVFYLWK